MFVRKFPKPIGTLDPRRRDSGYLIPARVPPYTRPFAIENRGAKSCMFFFFLCTSEIVRCTKTISKSHQKRELLFGCRQGFRAPSRCWVAQGPGHDVDAGLCVAVVAVARAARPAAKLLVALARPLCVCMCVCVCVCMRVWEGQVCMCVCVCVCVL